MDKSCFWDYIIQLGTLFLGPWLLLGDQNAISASHEKSGRSQNGSSSPSNCLRHPIDSLVLIVLGFSGYPFTWDNLRVSFANIQKRLDRGLSTTSWIHRYPNSQVSHLTMGTSDPCPLLLCTMSSQSLLPRPFHFEEFWICDLSSHYVISQAWLSSTGPPSSYSLRHKLNATQAALKKWNKIHFGFIKDKTSRLLSEIEIVQKMLPSVTTKAKLSLLCLRLDEQYQREKLLWKQKSREVWLIKKNSQYQILLHFYYY